MKHSSTTRNCASLGLGEGEVRARAAVLPDRALEHRAWLERAALVVVEVVVDLVRLLGVDAEQREPGSRGQRGGAVLAATEQGDELGLAERALLDPEGELGDRTGAAALAEPADAAVQVTVPR